MSKRITMTALGIITAAIVMIGLALAMNTIIVKQSFAGGGQCGGCAKVFAPGTESGTGGTIGGGHEPAKAFAPGQISSESASEAAPGHVKP
jgi:hypothetical protein